MKEKYNVFFPKMSRLLGVPLAFATLFFSGNVSAQCTATNVPYTEDFESVTAPAIPACDSVAQEGTGNLWETANTTSYGFNGNVLRYTYNSNNPANTWFYTQGINLNAGQSYRLIYSYGATTFTESLKVAYGTAQNSASMTNQLADYPALTGNSRNDTIDFTPSSTGVYYIGFQAYSAADEFYLMVDNISLNYSPAACSGAPDAGTISTVSSICSGISFDLNGTYIDELGITYQWQSSPAGANTWSNIAGATSNNYMMSSGISDATDFRMIVTCTNSSLSDTSNVVSVTMNAAQDCYCTPVYSDGCSDYGDDINDLSLVGENGTSINDVATGCSSSTGSYDDRRAITDTVQLMQGMTYSLTTSTEDEDDNIANVWIDFNDNGIFDANELVGSTPTSYMQSTPVTFSVAIPVTAQVGLHRMRVRNAYGTDATTLDPCSSKLWGETHDYMITVITAPSCNGTPTAGTINAPTSICSGNSFDLTNTGASTGMVGLTYQWQSSPDGNTWTDIAGATTMNYTESAGITSATSYRFIVTCTNSSSSDTSNIVSITINSVTECYCTPSYSYDCSDGDGIDDFTLNGENGTAISDLGTGCSGGYDDRRALADTVELNQGGTYTADFTNSGVADDYIAIWIDFNNDGDFDATELIGTSDDISTTPTFSVNIPTAAQTGLHRMRAMLGYGYDINYNTVTPDQFDPCNVSPELEYGETQDYMVNVLCVPPIVNLGADTSICSGNSITLDAGNTGANYTWNTGATTQTIDATAAGDYSVIVSNGGCDAKDTINVTINSSPVVNLGADTSICSGNSITLDAGNTGANYTWNTGATTQTIDVATSGDYNVTVVNVNGCSSSDTIQVGINPLPTVSGITYTSEADGFHFQASGVANATSYEWNFGDGTAHATTATPTHEYADGGDFVVSLKVSNDCGDSTISINVHNSGVGLQTLANDNSLLLYPNPANAVINLKSESAQQMKTITVYNLMGQVVYENSVIDGKQTQLNVAGYAEGVYNVRITLDNGASLQRKFEVKK